MKTNTIVKVLVDIGMTIILMLLMAYELVGRQAHEWLGMGMMALFILHHVLNRKWSKSIFKGKYALFRLFQTIVVLIILITMLGSMISGIMLSEYVFAFVKPGSGYEIFRNIHMLSAYWGFVFMSIHIGTNVGVMTDPIWWGIAAWPVNEFITSNDFSDKTVIPFCTSSSSGLGQSGELLEEMAGRHEIPLRSIRRRCDKLGKRSGILI
ncbi:DUF4405 domain-containing protein [Butyrivibrio sp. LC3010]|uniref:DUF4405 domain-containing protein n=1 Tax=Butyrivibrio sp. LC3010 TaxID=1280680 RepID=UPI0004108948|nr:DUF4405 domain-containing protein [Butyrivibrio sp. LC3010]